MLQAHKNSPEKVEENYFIQPDKRNTLKIFHIFWKLHENLFMRFLVMLLTDRQTNRQANATTSMKT